MGKKHNNTGMELDVPDPELGDSGDKRETEQQDGGKAWEDWNCKRTSVEKQQLLVNHEQHTQDVLPPAHSF